VGRPARDPTLRPARWPRRCSGKRGIVSRTASGREILVAHEKILPGFCRLVAQAEAEGAFATVVLCGVGWAAVPRRRPLIDSGALFPANIRALAGSQRLGIIKPSPGMPRGARV